jgi:signal transduction histidine kinase
VPGLQRIAIVGDAFETQTVYRHFKDYLPQVAKEFEVIDLTGLPMSDLQTRVGSLPEATAILYTAIYSDGRGVYFPPAEALKLFAPHANRPIVIAIETNLGSGAIGGYLLKAGPIGAEAGRFALRIINGENAANIPVTKADVVRPIFDWRQLERWGVKASALPAHSEIRFRPPPAEIHYGWVAAYIAGAILGIGAIILIVYERRKRLEAEDASRRRISELAIVNRHATAGEMSAAIAHELRQPLGSILNDAEAAELILRSDKPNLEDLKELVADIRRSDRRASDIIKQVRSLLSKTTGSFHVLDLNRTARQAIEIAKIQADASNVTLHIALNGKRLPVVGDTIQLQQVFINLIMNSIDAVKDRPAGYRDVVISSSHVKGHHVEVSVSDSGPGISDENLIRVFEPFFSTKDSGMGVGLSLSRTIVEAHNGSISAANGNAGGAIFRFRLPLSRGILQ